MFKGITFALAACLIWGLIFIVPQYMTGFSPIEIALGRYVVYGTISIFILMKARLQGLFHYPLSIWIKAIYYSAIMSIGYYTCVVFSVRYSSPAICALILGISPITIAFYGNWKQKECSFKSLIIPSLLIFTGLIIINASHVIGSAFSTNYALGLLCSFLALIAWSWYVVVNSQFLKSNPHVASSDWSTLMGVCSLFWVCICTLFLLIFFEEQLNVQKYFILNDMLIRFLAGCAILGVLCSWLGAFLWNKASFYLPVSLAGQLTVFENIFGLTFVYILESRLPAHMETLGMVFILVAVILGIKASVQTSMQHA